MAMKLRLMLAVTTLALGVAACGGSSVETTTTGAETGTPVSSSTAAPATAAAPTTTATPSTTALPSTTTTVAPTTTSLAPVTTTAAPTTTTSPTVQVPLVTQLLYDDAMVRLNNVGLDVVTIVRDVPLDSPTVGQVTDQQLTAYEEVEVGSTVTITVDQVPTVETPNVVGLDYQDAVAQLNLLGFAIRTTSTSYTVGVNVGEVY